MRTEKEQDDDYLHFPGHEKDKEEKVVSTV